MLFKRLRQWTFILACLSAVSCGQSLSSNSIDSNQKNSSQADNLIKSRQIETTSDNSGKETLQTVNASPNDNFPMAKKGQCLADNAPRPRGLSENININEQSPMPQTAEEFNQWLSDLLGSQIVLDRRFADISVVGDFNGDGCNDVAVPVTPDTDYEVVSRPDDPRAKARTNRNFNEYLANFGSCNLYLINLQNNASELTCSRETQGNQNDFAKQFSTQSSTAILIVYGGKKGWSWKANADGRTALLLNVWSSQIPKTDSNTIEFNIVSHGYKYDEYALPKTANGDGIYIGLSSSLAKSDKNNLTKRRLIYFNGNNYQLKELPDITTKKQIEP
jgi:hypothetical protein